jgi:hypothetical protein
MVMKTLPECDLDGIENRLSGQLCADARGILVFPDGEEASDPLSWAARLRREFGSRVKIYGFWAFENPAASTLNEIRERHDFAVLDNRWLIDFWISRHYPEDGAGRVDLLDPEDYEAARAIYGDPERWERDLDMEARVDLRANATAMPVSAIAEAGLGELHS